MPSQHLKYKVWEVPLDLTEVEIAVGWCTRIHAKAKMQLWNVHLETYGENSGDKTST